MIERALRHYLLSKREIRNLVSQHVYAGRIRQGVDPTLSVLITKVGTLREYTLAGESDVVTSTISLEVMSTTDSGHSKVIELAELARQSLSGLTGLIGSAGYQVDIFSCHVERDVMPEPEHISGSEFAWVYSLDLRILHSQVLCDFLPQ